MVLPLWAFILRNSHAVGAYIPGSGALKLVATRLDGAGIAYMLSGSMAMNYYAQPRMTRDLDVVVELTAADAGRVTALFARDFYCDPDTIRDAIAHQGMFNLIHTERVVKVDCIVRKDTLYRRTEFNRRRSVPLQNRCPARHGFPCRPGEEVTRRQRRFPAVLRCAASPGGSGRNRGT